MSISDTAIAYCYREIAACKLSSVYDSQVAVSSTQHLISSDDIASPTSLPCSLGMLMNLESHLDLVDNQGAV